jgi:hypothetical protein
MTDTPAAELRAAAARLRKLVADLGDNRGPWYIANADDHPYPQSIRNVGVPYVVADTYADPPHAPTEAQYICAMHPGVGAALAAWLDRAAHGWESLIMAAAQVLDPYDPKQVDAATILNSGPYDAQEALTLARLINASEPTS